MVVLVQGDGADARLAVGFQGDEGDALDGALPADIIRNSFSSNSRGDHHGGDGHAGIQGQHVDDGSTPAVRPASGIW